MRNVDPDSKKEHLLYLAGWVVAFAAVPAVIALRGNMGQGGGFDVRRMLSVWSGMLPFLLLFVAHDRLAAPLLLKKRKVLPYLGVALPLYALFAAAIFLTDARPQEMRPEPLPPPGEAAWFAPFGEPGGGPGEEPGPPPPPGGHGKRPLDFEILQLVIGALMTGANLGIKSAFRSRKDGRDLQQLREERESRRQELHRAQASLAQLQTEMAARAVPEGAADKALYFKKDRGTVRLDPSQIRYVESMSEYIRIWLDDSDEPLTVLYRLRNLASELPEGEFLQIHRSHLVKLSRVREVSRSSVTLEDGKSLPIGESYRLALREYLNSKKS